MGNKRKFQEFHAENPHVYELFKRFSIEAIKNGHKRLSAWLIVNRIRWETSIVTKSGDFKISNNAIAYYSRMFMHDHPSYKGFFRTKPLQEELYDE